MLCQACRRILGEIQKNPSSETPFQHHDTVLDWRRAVEEGCLICRRLNEFLFPDDGSVTPETARLVAQTFSPYKDDGIEVEAVEFDIHAVPLASDIDAGLFGPHGNFWLWPVMAGKDRLTFPGYVPTKTVGSGQSMGLVRDWINRCNSHHTACKRPEVSAGAGWAPDRLIHIDDANSRLRLVRGDSLPPGTTYTTLSHRWGKIQHNLFLTQSNIASWHEQLPSLGKWKTFSDAVEVSRQLGVPYIWIDSLCIIQDSLEDWQQQYPQMCDVYKRSYCNIAATSARDDTAGCFFERNLDMDLPLRLSFGADGAQLGTSDSTIIAAAGSHDLQLRGSYDLCMQQTWIHDINEAPLNGRGWVLQERLLTPRVLNFTKSQMYWECDEMQASESYPYVFPREEWGHVARKSKNPFALRNIDTEPKDSGMAYDTSIVVREAFRIWGNAVAAYTTGDPVPVEEGGAAGYAENLTNASDKLVAISAIAQELQPYLNCRYLAGHWETDLVRQLAWTGGNASDRSKIYRAPSWSWTSVDATIDEFLSMYTFFSGVEKDFRSLVEVVNVEVGLLTDDPLGQVTSGSLTLRGHLIDLEVRSLMSSRYGPCDDGEEEVILVNGERTCLHVQLDDDEEDSRPLAPWHVSCVPISLSIGHPSVEDPNGELEFKAILVAQSGVEGVYERVGFLGANITQQLTLDDFRRDPILRSVGTFSRVDEKGIFSTNNQDLRQIEIV